MTYEFKDVLKRWSGEKGWFYIRLPKQYYEEIRQIGTPIKAGFGSIKVTAKIGNTIWDTSIFPDTEDKSYILFIKKSVRITENLELDKELFTIVKIKI